MTKIGPIRRMSDPRLEQHLLETLDPEAVHGAGRYRPTSTTPTPMIQTTSSPPRNSVSSVSVQDGGSSSSNDAMPSMPTSAMNEDYTAIVAQHDSWLQDVQGRHNQAFDSLLKRSAGQFFIFFVFLYFDSVFFKYTNFLSPSFLSIVLIP